MSPLVSVGKKAVIALPRRSGAGKRKSYGTLSALWRCVKRTFGGLAYLAPASRAYGHVKASLAACGQHLRAVFEPRLRLVHR